MLLELASCRFVREKLKLQTLSVPQLGCMKQGVFVCTLMKPQCPLGIHRPPLSFEVIKHKHRVETVILTDFILSSPECFPVLRQQSPEAENNDNRFLAPLTNWDSL